MRARKPTDFSVEVEDVGTFVFAKRTMADELKIQVEYSKILDGAPATDWLMALAGWISTLNVLTVVAPEGWDIDEMDPTEPDTYAKLNRVFQALAAKELSFRPGTKSLGA